MKTKTIKVSREGQEAEVEVEVFETFVEAVKFMGKANAMRRLNYGYVQHVRAEIYRTLGKEEEIPDDIQKYIDEHPELVAKRLQEKEEE